MSREQYIKATFSRTHFIDIRATVGRLIMPTPGKPSPSCRNKDVSGVLEGVGLSVPSEVSVEMKRMQDASMIHVVNHRPHRWENGGTYYQRAETEESALSWRIVEAGALAVATLYPDSPYNQAWLELLQHPAA